MADTIFEISPEVASRGKLHPKVDYIEQLRVAFRRPIEAAWKPTDMLISCKEEHALLLAISYAFYHHLPLRLTPDIVWITIARGFALHVNENAEALRHRFVSHSGRETLTLHRMDFFPGQDNPWEEVFEAFNGLVSDHTGGLSSLVEANFSTTGTIERAVSSLMVMETFKAYFEYDMRAGCGIPRLTLTGTVEDWEKIRARVQLFAEYGLEEWTSALDPVLTQFVAAKSGKVDVDFWKSMFRYNSGSGPAVMTGWVNVLFPYFKDHREILFKNPYLHDWKRRLEIDDRQHWRERWGDPQGIGIKQVPASFTSVPLKLFWGSTECTMRIVGGLMGVTQNSSTLEVAAECGWVLLYDQPIDIHVDEASLLRDEIPDAS